MARKASATYPVPVRLPGATLNALDRKSRLTGIPMAELIRRAIDRMLVDYPGGTAVPNPLEEQP